MSKIFRITVASAVVAGVAALSPLSAQAKSVTDLAASYTADSCTSAPSIQGTVSGTTFTLDLPTTGVYDVVARVYIPGTRQTFPRKTVLEGVSGHVIGKVKPGEHIWRVDAADPLTDALLYTSDGVLGCD